MKVVSILVGLVFPFFLIGQDISISESLSLRSDVGYALLGRMKDKVLLYRDKNMKYEIQAFDDKMRKSWTKELDLNKKRPKVIDVIPEKESFSLFYFFKKNNHTVLKMHRYDAAANLKDSVTIQDDGFNLVTPDYELVYSADHTKVLVYYLEQQSTIHTIMFDLNTLRVMWRYSLQPESMNYYRDFETLIVDNDGGLHLVLSKDNIKSKQETHHYEFHYVSPSGKQAIFYKVPLQGLLTYDVHFEYDNVNKKIIVGGLYSDKQIFKADGYFYMSIPPNSPQSAMFKAYQFQEDFVADLFGKEAKKGVMDIDIHQMVARHDGGGILIGERKKIYERRLSGIAPRAYRWQTPSTATATSFSRDFHFEDMFMVAVNKDGDLEWERVLHKKQFSQDDNAIFSSFFLFKTPQQLRLLFNDDIKMENTVSEYVINPKGNIDRNSLLSTDYQELKLRFQDAMQVAYNEVIVPSEHRGRLKLIRLVY